MAYDILGDIHGQAEKLVDLLKKLGYQYKSGAWRHRDREVRFVGDFIDRGPKQLETLDIVRRMVDAGSAKAVMGNHEFNAIAFHTQDPLDTNSHLRVRNKKNYGQHESFLREVGEDSALHKEWVQWFYNLPLWIEEDKLRLVHACWHSKYMNDISSHLNADNTLTKKFVELSSRKGTPEFDAVEAICKGTEVTLPAPFSFSDNEGNVRNKSRTKWWDGSADTYRSAPFLKDELTKLLPDTKIPDFCLVNYDNKKPVFFGHYWFKGDPSVVNAKACCVDYSAAVGDNPLVAYQWDGEEDLTDNKFVSSYDREILVDRHKKIVSIR